MERKYKEKKVIYELNRINCNTM